MGNGGKRLITFASRSLERLSLSINSVLDKRHRFDCFSQYTSIFTRVQSQTQTDYVLKVWSLPPLRIFMLLTPDGYTSIFTRAQSQTQTDYVLKVWSLLPLRIFMLLTPDGCTNLYKGPPSQTQTDYVLKVWSMWLPWKHSCSHSDPSESYMDIPWGSKRTQNRLCLESSTEDCSPLGIPMSLFRPSCWSLEPEAEHLEAIGYGFLMLE